MGVHLFQVQRLESGFYLTESTFGGPQTSEKKRVSTQLIFRQLLFFGPVHGPMFFKLAVTFQKDAPGDTDHGERLSGQKY